jgi:hypothetical protein
MVVVAARCGERIWSGGQEWGSRDGNGGGERAAGVPRWKRIVQASSLLVSTVHRNEEEESGRRRKVDREDEVADRSLGADQSSAAR